MQFMMFVLFITLVSVKSVTIKKAKAKAMPGSKAKVLAKIVTNQLKRNYDHSLLESRLALRVPTNVVLQLESAAKYLKQLTTVSPSAPTTTAFASWLLPTK